MQLIMLQINQQTVEFMGLWEQQITLFPSDKYITDIYS